MNQGTAIESIDWAQFSSGEEIIYSDNEDLETQIQELQAQSQGQHSQSQKPDAKGELLKNILLKVEEDAANNSKQSLKQKVAAQKSTKKDQPAEEIIKLINEKKGTIFINLFDVHFETQPEELRALYPNVKITDVIKAKEGNFLLACHSKEEAIKLVHEGSKSIKDRKFYMRMGIPTKEMVLEWNSKNRFNGSINKKKIVERKLNRSNASSKHSVNSKQNDKQPKKEENKKTAEPDSPTRNNNETGNNNEAAGQESPKVPSYLKKQARNRERKRLHLEKKLKEGLANMQSGEIDPENASIESPNTLTFMGSSFIESSFMTSSLNSLSKTENCDVSKTDHFILNKTDNLDNLDAQSEESHKHNHSYLTDLAIRCSMSNDDFKSEFREDLSKAESMDQEEIRAAINLFEKFEKVHSESPKKSKPNMSKNKSKEDDKSKGRQKGPFKVVYVAKSEDKIPDPAENKKTNDGKHNLGEKDDTLNEETQMSNYQNSPDYIKLISSYSTDITVAVTSNMSEDISVKGLMLQSENVKNIALLEKLESQNIKPNPLPEKDEGLRKYDEKKVAEKSNIQGNQKEQPPKKEEAKQAESAKNNEQTKNTAQNTKKNQEQPKKKAGKGGSGFNNMFSGFVQK